MKLIGLIKGDIRQQYKYGFYALYALMTVVYIGLLHALPMEWKERCASLVVFSDPVLIGLMFVGAIILFEKNEKVMHALAVSPISVHQYILSKVLSIGVVSLLSGGLIALFGGVVASFCHLVIGIVLGSALFTLIGISLSALITTLNGYVLIMVFTLNIAVIPVLLTTIGYEFMAMQLHPSIALVGLISGEVSALSLGTITISLLVMYIISCKAVKKMMKV